MEKYIFKSEQRDFLESMQIPFAIYQFINKRVYALILSDGFCKLLGYDDREKAYYDMDHNMYMDTHPDDVSRISEAAYKFATEGGSYEVIYRSKKKNSSDYTIVHARGEHFVTETGVTLAQVWYTDEGTFVEDGSTADFEITHTLTSVLREQGLTKAARYDFLTGLPSMTGFFELADAGKAGILEHGGRPALLYMDISGMKFFNSKFGFTSGDKMLQSFSRILIRIFESENCGRIGADHFAVITEEEGLEGKLEQLFRDFQDQYHEHTPPVHVGIYPYQVEDVPVSIACDRAKFACRTLSGSYISDYHYYIPEQGQDEILKQYIIEHIDIAIREKWIQVYYQPIIRALTEKVCDMEALARWIDPKKGFMNPASFIPALEESGLIYKLDLYMLDQILDNIKTLEAAGVYVVPHSVNLSRSDFDACDIVEEIRSRVDAAGVSRDRITIEITESIIGTDFEFIKEQVARFQDLGFPVWMDDFGSGYSSLDVLQSIRFDLLKFDMSFMRRLDEGESGKIILTELMKMATAMGLETICEGVETEEQVRFLQEIGCSKLQGYYFDKPGPFSRVLQWCLENHNKEIENPAESGYYESIGQMNLYDLDVLAEGDENSIHNIFNTLPMGIIEVRDDSTRFVRSNQSYRDFIRRFFGLELSRLGTGYAKYDVGFMLNIVKKCCEQGQRSFFDEKMPDGSTVHSFARRIGENPVTGDVAVAIAVLSIDSPDEGTTYTEIARALAADYYNIYLVNLDTDDYVEYTSRVCEEELALERKGHDFFESARKDARVRVYEKDQELFLSWFSKENIIRELDTQGAFTTDYRLVDSGTPVYVNMKITRMQTNKKRIIIGISMIDTYMKQKEQYQTE